MFAMAIDNWELALQPPGVVTSMVAVLLPAAVGVPETTPVRFQVLPTLVVASITPRTELTYSTASPSEVERQAMVLIPAAPSGRRSR
jgi:hypothetical protein